jgi:serum/glucocorticoid-regulated kinase 2
MYVRVLQDELTFPEDKAMDQDTKSLIRGLLQRNPALRLCEPRIKKHPYFSMIDWQHVYHKRYIPPYIPPIDPANASDTQNFDDAFLEMEPILDTDIENDDQTGSERDRSTTDVDIAGIDDEVSHHGDSPSDKPRDDVFDGYSFKARNSVLIEDDDGNEGSDESDNEAPLTRSSIIEDDELEAGQKTPEAQVKVVPPTPTPASEVVEAFRKQQEVERASTATSPVGPQAETAEPNLTAVSEEVEPTSAQTPRNKVDGLPAEHAPPTPEKDQPKPSSPTVTTAIGPVVPKKDEKEKKVVTISDKPRHKVAEPSKGKKMQKPARRERSGVAALDRDLSDVMDEDEMQIDMEDDDWDFVEALGQEDYNGQQGKSLFARGVVDRYRLKVFRKPSNSVTSPKPLTMRNFSGTSRVPQGSESEFGEMSMTASPTPSERKRPRGGGLSLRKPRTFLRPKSPSATYSAGSSKLSRPGISTQHSATISGSSSGALLTPVVSTPLTTNGTTSLKSHPSMNSMGSPGSSDNSVNGGDLTRVSLTQSAAELASSPGKNRSNKSSPDLRRQARESNAGDDSRQKGLKKMRKYTEQGAEKVMSLFSSQRPSPTVE